MMLFYKKYYIRYIINLIKTKNGSKKFNVRGLE